LPDKLKYSGHPKTDTNFNQVVFTLPNISFLYFIFNAAFPFRAPTPRVPCGIAAATEAE
jgi:hypothetical protein